MANIKIKVKKTSEEEIEISIPAFRKESDWIFYKILSEDSLIKVAVYGYGATIVKYKNDAYEVGRAINHSKSNEAEFSDGLKRARRQINKVLLDVTDHIETEPEPVMQN